jgi:adenine-specific DNA methylase
MVMKIIKDNVMFCFSKIQECYNCRSIVEIEESDVEFYNKDRGGYNYYYVCPCCGHYIVPRESKDGFIVYADKKREEQRKKAEERKRLEREANEMDNNFKIYSFIILGIIITYLVVWGIVNLY